MAVGGAAASPPTLAPAPWRIYHPTAPAGQSLQRKTGRHSRPPGTTERHPKVLQRATAGVKLLHTRTIMRAIRTEDTDGSSRGGGQMSVVTPKTVRQQLVQSAVLDKIITTGLSVDTEPVRRSLQTIRRQVNRSPLMERYLDRWDTIVRTNDIDDIRRIVETDDDTSREMRNLSPLSVLLSDDERRRVLTEFRTRLKATAQR
ncbi:hypothetical protein [Rhodococcus sp. DMU2021]|uniref:hypothetical protein n=1 Tax=Rhodococcus sp. DMU2021 TaxID=2866997 RepID=UPI002176BF7D|nr:hypothetical protein [Rhodococcus sp. DMU2021]